ncbi:hypothetical protein [Nocardia sp. NPDC052566]|uniref:hypothetical protein n=1 Tax=Nocardia sp. NPDC052566 TaxID=3364330 RepID=UPI0037CBD1CA
MAASFDAQDGIARAWRDCAAERERAERSARIAAEYEAAAQLPPESMRPFRRRIAKLHRTMEARHAACARLHRLYALRLQRWHGAGGHALRPVFMTVVAEMLRMDGAGLTLFGNDQEELLIAASDGRSHEALELELTLDEGPAREAARGCAVRADGVEIADRWPRYGPAAAQLGIDGIVAVPLSAGTNRLGALCGFGADLRERPGQVAEARRIAEILTTSILLTVDESRTGGALHGPVFDDADYLDTVHQAVGMVAVQCRCDTETARVLLRARAFADGVRMRELASRVVRHQSRLD